MAVIPMFLLGCFFVVISIIYQFVYKYFVLRNKLKLIPGPKAPLFIGSTLEIINIPHQDRLAWFSKLFSIFTNGLVVIWFGMEPIIFIRKPRHMEVILPSTELITKSSVYDTLEPWLGEGLITSRGAKWFKHRRILTPAFYFNILEVYAAVMCEKVEILSECIRAKMQENPNAPVNIFEMIVKFSLDTICETAMGINMESQRKSNIEYINAIHNMSRLTHERMIRPWLKSDFLFYLTQRGKDYANSVKISREFTEKVIKQRQAERKQKLVTNEKEDDVSDEFGKRKRKAFIDLLLDANENTENSLTQKELQEEVQTFMFAGHDTTAAAISWSLFALGNAPEIQAKVHNELKETFGNNNSAATVKEINQLKYLDRVIKEVLRLYPSVPSIGRYLDRDVVIDNHVIPKGLVLSLQIYQMHRDPEVWDDPETFDPDRFLPENCQGRHPYSYVPFSAGPRNCIGQKFALLEIKITLTAILRKWRVTSVLKPSEMKKIPHLILRPNEDKIDLYFTALDNC